MKKLLAAISALVIAGSVLCSCSIESVKEHDKKAATEVSDYAEVQTGSNDKSSDKDSSDSKNGKDKNSKDGADSEKDKKDSSSSDKNKNKDQKQSDQNDVQIYTYYVDERVTRYVTRYENYDRNEQNGEETTRAEDLPQENGGKTTQVVTGTVTRKPTTTSTKARIKVDQAKIDVSSILNNPDLSDSAKSAIPSDGILIPEYELQVVEGRTVFDVLKLVLENEEKSLDYTSTQYGIYVRSIAGLGEKQCGSKSGWTYKVNGTTPMKSCDKYVLKAGDVVEWVYVTSP